MDTDTHTVKKKDTWRLGLNGHMGVLFAGLVMLTGLLLGGIGYRLVTKVSADNMKVQVSDTTIIVKSELDAIRQPISPMLSAMAQGLLSGYYGLKDRLKLLPVLKSYLDNHQILDALFMGYANGDYFMLYRLDLNIESHASQAPLGAKYCVVNVSHPDPREEYLFYDEGLRLLSYQQEKSQSRYDPRERPWYKEAMVTSGQTKGVPSMGYFTKQPSVVFSEKTHDNNAVIATSVFLERFSETLRRELPTPGSYLALINSDGTLVSRARDIIVDDSQGRRVRVADELPLVLRLARQKYLDGQRGRAIEINDGAQDWQVSIEEFDNVGVADNVMLLAIPTADLSSASMTFLLYAVLGTTGIAVFSSPFIWLALRRISRPLHDLALKAGSMHEFVLDEEGKVQSGVSEIQALARSMQLIQENIRGMLNIIQAISTERDFDALLRYVLEETLSLLKVDGGIVALLGEGKKTAVDHGSMCWLIDGKKVTSTFENNAWKPDVALATYQALAQDAVIQTCIDKNDRRSVLKQVAPGFADSDVTRLDTMCLPLRDRMGEHIGALVLFRRNKSEDRNIFQPEEVGFIETFGTMVAIALDNHRLLRGQTELRDALIHIMAGAIDAKSPYTGGHCERVPIIFQMLLEAACAEREGPLKDFNLDEYGWEEAKLAAWLHDCGKVTTPEYVVDKATKLETLYDRIHEIRTRFEVLKRDAVIDSLRKILAGAEPEAARQDLKSALRALDDDFAFVASCNAGGEDMSEAALERLSIIGKRKWLRTLDKHLGVSRDERARLERAGKFAYPVWENLLMDNPEHIIERTEKDWLDPNNAWGFRMAPSPALYNRGELHNLSIRQGTLTEEERYKVNEHISRTIIMLESMPLPKHLRGMPEIAGAHHETMDGKGYPRGLKREDMSWEARMMAVADIFEALTAWDRPYKSSKTLRETLEIMDGFKERNHIDPDVYELFLKSDIPQRYASGYLKPEQNDL